MSEIIIGDDPHLEHYGIIRKSGRYPWGSGQDPYQRGMDFYRIVDELRAKGLSDKEIADSFKDPKDPKDKFTTTMLDQTRAIAKNEIRAQDRAFAMRLREKGMSVSAIGRRMGKTESSIRSLLDDQIAARQAVLKNVSNDLKSQVDEKGYIDISKGVEIYAGVAREKFNTAVALLKSEGYKVFYVGQEQMNIPGQKTTVMVLGRPDSKFPDLAKDFTQIKMWGSYSEDGGETPFQSIKPPRSVDSKKVKVVYGPEGGAEKDGLIELRRGVDYLDMGNSTYAQVRILVDGTHYLKGMAVVRDDLPSGVDIQFNTNKDSTGNKLDAMKGVEPDPTNPFGASIKRQKTFKDAQGKEQLTALNILDEEGDWYDWSKTLSSQMLSKQPTSLIKSQLNEFRDHRKMQLDEIKQITNPTLKKELLRQFSEKLDSDAVDLKAMGLPGTSNHVLIPIPEMKDNEVYARNYPNGTRVALIRHPHGGIFEIPELVVNNKVPAARKILGDTPRDAIGINSKVAQQLSGADFDGDTVLVIPNNTGKVKASRPIQSLIEFDPKVTYKGFDGMKTMKNTQTEMGIISNLITDMSVKGAPVEEIVRAVKHSMVVIDAEKHGLNYKQSYKDHGIQQLKKEYQSGGASTLISRASADIRVPNVKPRPAAQGGPIDQKTGRKMFVPKGDEYVVETPDGPVTVYPRHKTTRMRETLDTTGNARNLMSSKTGTDVERAYADHANTLHTMANNARLEMISTPNIKKNSAATKTYAPEVKSLGAKLKVAKANAPRERQAQILAGAKVKARMEANPDMPPDKLKKVRSQELRAARDALGAKKEKIDITPREWEAIQQGAISHTPLLEILNNADPVQVKQYSLPREMQGIQGPRLTRARSMVSNGYSQSEIAEALGVSVSVIQEFLKNN